jgi:hypothetical protein
MSSEPNSCRKRQPESNRLHNICGGWTKRKTKKLVLQGLGTCWKACGNRLVRLKKAFNLRDGFGFVKDDSKKRGGKLKMGSEPSGKKGQLVATN